MTTLPFTYDGVTIGDYGVDLVVKDAVLFELSAARAPDSAHRAQCVNYLRATGLRLCRLLNFGTRRPEIRRVVLDL